MSRLCSRLRARPRWSFLTTCCSRAVPARSSADAFSSSATSTPCFVSPQGSFTRRASTRELWIYDLRTNKHFTLKTNTLARGDLDDFVDAYRPGERHKRAERERFRRFTYDDVVSRDKASLDIFWLRDESLEDSDNMPPPGVIAAEIVEDLEAALAEFTELAEALQGIGVELGEDRS